MSQHYSILSISARMGAAWFAGVLIAGMTVPVDPEPLAWANEIPRAERSVRPRGMSVPEASGRVLESERFLNGRQGMLELEEVWTPPPEGGLPDALPQGVRKRLDSVRHQFGDGYQMDVERPEASGDYVVHLTQKVPPPSGHLSSLTVSLDEKGDWTSGDTEASFNGISVDSGMLIEGLTRLSSDGVGDLSRVVVASANGGLVRFMLDGQSYLLSRVMTGEVLLRPLFGAPKARTAHPSAVTRRESWIRIRLPRVVERGAEIPLRYQLRSDRRSNKYVFACILKEPFEVREIGSVGLDRVTTSTPSPSGGGHMSLSTQNLDEGRYFIIVWGTNELLAYDGGDITFQRLEITEKYVETWSQSDLQEVRESLAITGKRRYDMLLPALDGPIDPDQSNGYTKDDIR